MMRFGRARGRLVLRTFHPEERAHGVGGYGAAEQPALSLGEAKLLKLAADLLRFHAFRGDWHLQRVPKARDAVDDRFGLLALHVRAYEALVDLDAVDRQRVDLRERGIAGPKIVERDAHAEVLEALHDRQYLVA